MYLTTPNGPLQLEIPDEDFERLYFYVPALFSLTTYLVTVTQENPEYEPSFGYLLDELMHSRFGASLEEGELLALVRRSTPVDVDKDVRLNFNCFPELFTSLPQDPMLMHSPGVLVGLATFVTAAPETFYSPGQVLDIAACLEHCELESGNITHAPTLKAFKELWQFFTKASQRSLGIMQQQCRPEEVEEVQ